MREEEEKNSMDTKSLSDVFCTRLSCEREKDFRCRECERRLLGELYYERVEAVLFLVRSRYHSSFFFVTAHPASLLDGIVILKSARSWCYTYPRSFLNIHLEDKLCFLVAITASSRWSYA